MSKKYAHSDHQSMDGRQYSYLLVFLTTSVSLSKTSIYIPSLSRMLDTCTPCLATVSSTYNIANYSILFSFRIARKWDNLVSLSTITQIASHPLPDLDNLDLLSIVNLSFSTSNRDDGIFISQDYVAEILKKFDFATVKTTSTPIETNKALVKDEEAEAVDVHLYRSMIGSLMYLTASRPDIMFVVCACARFQVTPKTSHIHVVKRIFRYLKGQPKLGLWYPRDSPFDLEAFSDSDYAGASLDRKSTTGGCQFLGKRLISWQCKKQTIVANSTTEAEYVAAANCCGQVLWIQNQMLDYGFNFMNTKIYIDNESTICIVKNPVFHSKTKHIEIRHHFIRDSYEKKLIQVIKIHTDHNVADLLTKAFDVSRISSDSGLPLYMFDQLCSHFDGKAVVITDSSVRNDLLFNDEDGITWLTNDEIFENLALIGWQSQVLRNHRGAPAQTTSKRVLKQPNEPPLSEGHASRSGEDRMEHTFELMDIVPPTPYDLPLPRDLKQTKRVYGKALTKLVKKVKYLEDKLKSTLVRRNARMVISDDEEDLVSEDPSKQRRITETEYEEVEYELDQTDIFYAAKILADASRERVKTYKSYTRRRRSTVSSRDSTAGGLFSTAEEILSTDERIAQKLNEEEMAKVCAKSRQENQTMFEKEYNKIQTLFKKDTEVEKTKTKRVAEETLLQERFKKLRTTEASRLEPTQEQPTEEPKELFEEKRKHSRPLLEIELSSQAEEIKVE
ncbi:hypothetical protein Tco_0904771 [Tanacetum coccineum]